MQFKFPETQSANLLILNSVAERQTNKQTNATIKEAMQFKFTANLLILNSVAERLANRTGRTGLLSGAAKRPLFCRSVIDELFPSLSCCNIHLLYCFKASLFFPFWKNKFPCSFPWKTGCLQIPFMTYFWHICVISPFSLIRHLSHSLPNEDAPSASRICQDFHKTGQPANICMKQNRIQEFL